MCCDRVPVHCPRMRPGPTTGRVPAAELLGPMVDILSRAAWAACTPSRPWLNGHVPIRGWSPRLYVGDSSGRTAWTADVTSSRHSELVPDDGVLPDLASIAADRRRDRGRHAWRRSPHSDRLRAPMPRSISALAAGRPRCGRGAPRRIRSRLAAPRLRGWSSFAPDRVECCGGRTRCPCGASPPRRGPRSRSPPVGVGDTGGIATLLVRLGLALTSTPGIAEVVTIGRGTVRDVLDVAAAPSAAPDSLLWRSNRGRYCIRRLLAGPDLRRART